MNIYPRRVLRAVLACVISIPLVPFASAQQLTDAGISGSAITAPEESESSGITITKRVDEVNLVFTVTDKHGRFVEKLPPSSFHLLDNRIDPGPLKFFHQQSNLPMRVALLIDLSDSVRARFQFEKKAAAIFLQHILRPKIDKAMVVGFDGKVHVQHPMTGNVSELKASISKLQAGGDTAFYDAVTLAAGKLRSADGTELTRRAIILISDGMDTASRNKLKTAQEAALQAGVVVFALSTNSISEPNAPGNKIMKELTEWTGGHILPAHESDELKSAFRRIEKALRSQYVLGYQPPEMEENGKFHSVEIVPQVHGLRVQCRRGYFAPVPSRNH